MVVLTSSGRVMSVCFKSDPLPLGDTYLTGTAPVAIQIKTRTMLPAKAMIRVLSNLAAVVRYPMNISSSA